MYVFIVAAVHHGRRNRRMYVFNRLHINHKCGDKDKGTVVDKGDWEHCSECNCQNILPEHIARSPSCPVDAIYCKTELQARPQGGSADFDE